VRRLTAATLALGTICVAAAGQSSAEEAAAEPWLQIDFPVEMQFDRTVSPGYAVLSDLYLTVEPSVVARLDDWLALEFGVSFEPVVDATNDRVLQDHGLYLWSAQVVAGFGPLTVQAGKFSPNFSIGFQLTPGLNGDTFNGDAEIWERVGLGAAYNLTGEGTESGVILSAAAFRRDTSVFSDSAFVRRGELDVADGGPGNHDGLESFSLALDVIDPSWAPGLHAHAGFVRQAAGVGDPEDATAWAAGAQWTFEAGESAQYLAIAEWVQTEDSFGIGEAESLPGASQSLLTLAAQGTWDETWTGAVVYGERRSDDPLAGAAHERFLQLTLGYFVTEDLSAEIGWQSFDDDTDTFDTISLRLATGFELTVE
jgi:hypothetical protein